MLKLHHAPFSRSSAFLWLMEELGVPYEVEIIEIRAESGAPDDYRAIQPHKKVPAIVHDGTVVTERAAITIYLGDAFPEAGLAPAITDPRRAEYLTALVYHDAVFDPVVCARVHGLSYVNNDYPFGLFDDMISNLRRKLADRPYVTGESFTLADVMLASSINYTMNMLKALPEDPIFVDYVGRVSGRPAFQRAQEKDAQFAADLPFFQEIARGKDS